ncbi:DUF2790 domain-containing protein [Pseudomonas segetis]|uniref:DUF2790 domain-containing protein n=1 Tax=Pseudomonas segetis TaxID=298908 RepID=A0A239HNB4_9PSED|nr:DUF2790 domain-containing protein [Pseudomonas segetis]SNS82373.1 Protein of unknown function [Pseudomonas segetis]
MNLKSITAACIFTSLSLGVLPAMAQAAQDHERYSYGTQLDVAQVVSLTEAPAQTCGVVSAHMTYLDSKGHTQVLDYSKLAQVCSQGG